MHEHAVPEFLNRPVPTWVLAMGLAINWATMSFFTASARMSAVLVMAFGSALFVAGYHAEGMLGACIGAPFMLLGMHRMRNPLPDAEIQRRQAEAGGRPWRPAVDPLLTQAVLWTAITAAICILAL